MGAGQRLPAHEEHTADLNCLGARYSLERHYPVRHEEHSAERIRLFVLCSCKFPPQVPRPNKESRISIASLSSSAD
jgi:hypothetical protein